LFLIYAFTQKLEADRQYNIAEEQRQKAVELQKEAEIARDDANTQKELAIAAKNEAQQERDRAEAEKKRAEENEAEAKKQELLAKENADRAERNAEQARINEKEAKKQEALAKENEARARRQRYLAQAKAMALKSQELDNNKELESLLAQQAYFFNTNWDGYDYDNDIYNGLFYALKNNGHELTKSLPGHDLGAARALVTDVAGDKIYSGGSDGRIIQWRESKSGWDANIITDATKRPNYQVYSLDVSPDGKFLLAAGLYTVDATRNFVELYDLNNPTAAPKKITGFVHSIEDIHFTPDGKGFYARDNAGKSIRYSDLSTAKEIISTSNKINAIDLSSDGSKIAGAADNGSLYIWDLKASNAVTELDKQSGRETPLNAVAFSPDGSQIVIGDERGVLKIYAGGLLIRTLSGHEGPIEEIKYNNKGDFMATASKDKTVRMWNITKLSEQPIELRDHADWVWSIAFSPSDEQIMIGLHSTRQVVREDEEELKKFIETEESIRAYPTKMITMAGILCGAYITRNLSVEEWVNYVGEDLDMEKTCDKYSLEQKK
jgi:hypothetical protein